MTGRATWQRWVAGLVAVLLIAMLGPAPAAASPVCADTAGVTQAIDAGDQAVVAETPADEVCPDGCLACAHCSSHHGSASLPAAPASAGQRFAKPERRGQLHATPLHSHLAYRLKRPPRA